MTEGTDLRSERAAARVYLLVHDDGMYGETTVFGVFRTREAAEAHRVTRTPSGRPSTAWDAHNKSCCGVQEWDVRDD